ncbi:MAG: hypothetical protein WAT71_04985 [Ignavibacteria bacterium]
MRIKKTLQLVSLRKTKHYYIGEVLIYFDAVKCMYGDHFQFKQKIIPNKLKQFVGKDISKWKSSIYVNCIIEKYETINSIITEGGEEYEVPTGISSNSRLKIIKFDSLRYNKEYKLE